MRKFLLFFICALVLPLSFAFGEPIMYAESEQSDSVYIQIQDADQTLYIDDTEFAITDIHERKRVMILTLQGRRGNLFTICIVHIHGREYFIYCDEWCWSKFIYKFD